MVELEKIVSSTNLSTKKYSPAATHDQTAFCKFLSFSEQSGDGHLLTAFVNKAADQLNFADLSFLYIVVCVIRVNAQIGDWREPWR